MSDIKIVAVTKCPFGSVYTYLAEEALKKVAKELKIDIKIESQGSMGIENVLTEKDIDFADGIILTENINDEKRFEGKNVVRVNIGDIVKDASSLVKNIINNKIDNSHHNY